MKLAPSLEQAFDASMEDQREMDGAITSGAPAPATTVDDGAAVRLLTVQPASMLRELETGETVSCVESESIEHGFGDIACVCYDWMAEAMVRHGVRRPDGCTARWPLWAWAYRRNGRGLLASEVWGGPGDGEDYVVLGLELPASRILLSSFYDWSAYPFGSCGSTGGLSMPDRGTIMRIDSDESGAEMDKWFAESEAMPLRAKEKTWERVLRTLDDLREPRRVDQYGLVPEGVEPVMLAGDRMGVVSASGEYRPSADEEWFDWLQATMWTVEPGDVRRTWRRGESLRGTASWLQWNQRHAD